MLKRDQCRSSLLFWGLFPLQTEGASRKRLRQLSIESSGTCLERQARPFRSTFLVFPCPATRGEEVTAYPHDHGIKHGERDRDSDRGRGRYGWLEQSQRRREEAPRGLSPPHRTIPYSHHQR